jgi:glycine hydroxymethyltransferase
METPMTTLRRHDGFLADLGLEEVDPFVAELIQWEGIRQRRKLILIPSESICPRAVREALASPFTSVYAEGYPPNLMEGATEEELRDVEGNLIRYRRYGDRRFYKGTEYVHFVEALAKARVTRLFATPQCPAQNIYANVQPLSGAAANNAVYQALLEPGEVIMGMALAHGGHLTHGSELNRSGRLYRPVPYSVSDQTGRIDYQGLRDLAREHRPKLIVAGFTSYPWAPDWQRLREIAEEVGAFLLADIAHPAGLVVAGLYPNPLGLAHVVTFTTHKTLCGPRGAVILTTDPSLAQKLDSAVFPGEQGGPHVNKIAAMAVAFGMARTETFKRLQRGIVENARALAEALHAEGVDLCYGGTDTHLLVVKLQGLGKPTGYPLLGEIASRVLDLAGLVVNRNSLPGDLSFAQATGIRLGTPWATQRGMGPREMREVASVIALILREIRPFTYQGSSGPLPRGKLPQRVLEEARARVRALLERTDPGLPPWDYPHETSSLLALTGRSPEGESVLLRIQGERAWAFLQEVCTRDLSGMLVGETRETFLLDEEGRFLDKARLTREGQESFTLVPSVGAPSRLATWLRNLSDGYVIFDPKDILIKVQGPVKVHLEPPGQGLGEPDQDPSRKRNTAPLAPELLREEPGLIDMKKPYFIGLWALRDSWPGQEEDRWEPPPPPPDLRRTPLYSRHRGLARKMARFAGWEMPIWYSSIQEEHRAVRNRAGLFDVTHMGTIGVHGPDAAHFLDLVSTNYVRWLRPGESQYGFLLSPDGTVLDDLMVYCLGQERYLLVVNAVNAGKDLSWLQAVARAQVTLDREGRGVRFRGEVQVMDLNDNVAGEDAMVDLALQGPASGVVLERMAATMADRWALRGLRKGQVTRVCLGAISLWVARTGYTGEQVGFELFVHPEKAPDLWDRILEAGNDLGVVPAGLGARDSLRIEAGLPLYGSELAGPLQIDPVEAGFGQFVKLHKPFFCGRQEMLLKTRELKRRLVRFRLAQRGVRMVRPGDLVIHRSGQQLMGWVTSAAPNGEGIQMGLALVEKRGAQPNTRIAILSNERAMAQPAGALSPGQKMVLHEEGLILSRFPGRDLSG